MGSVSSKIWLNAKLPKPVLRDTKIIKQLPKVCPKLYLLPKFSTSFSPKFCEDFIEELL